MLESQSLSQDIEQRIIEIMNRDSKFTVLIDIPDVAELLGINITRAYELAKMESFPSIQFGRRIKVYPIALLKWLEEEPLKGG